ncbi:polyprenyl synthetase family protein [Niastella caeni]|uniref:Polyprenyl synthetase family protein n=1 Tax=Niastella caeni TaxID=2569763 RepID=A0A4S8HIN5_9BACT|nr:polyprenyl synthetase family protein [Niastella caeni]THU34885.1 polyprenyl synthetase family protein [Niastella caeni]
MIAAFDNYTQNLSNARELISLDIERFEIILFKTLKTQRKYIGVNTLEAYKRGKKFRPILLMLSARLNGKEDPTKPLPDKIIRAAVSLEMMHTGSLIHDDIVDGATLRRGLPSLNAERGHEEALLIGNMQMIESMRSFVGAVRSKSDLRLVRYYMDTAFTLCRGEIDELRQKPSWKTAFLRKRYLRTIDRKTGKLIALACEAGARLVDARIREVIAMEKFGMYSGRAFQIMDDLKDIFHSKEDSGKEQFIDLKNRKISLPYIYVLEALPAQNPLKKILSGRNYTEADFQKATTLVLRSPGIYKAYSEARVYMIKAIEQLKIYESNPYALCLQHLLESVINN